MNLEMMKLLAKLLKSEREQKEREYDAAGCFVLAISTVLPCFRSLSLRRSFSGFP